MIYFLVTGSPLDARQSTAYMVPILIAAAVIAVAGGITMLIMAQKRKQQTPEWIEAQKKKPTTLSMVNKTARKFGLSLEEKAILWNACRMNDAPNIYYLVRDPAATDELFRKEYQAMVKRGRSAGLIYALFKLRYKLEAGADVLLVNSTHKIQKGQTIYIHKNEFDKFSMNVAEVAAEGLYLELPVEFRDKKKNPAAMSRARFSFSTPQNNAYTFVTRIIRYTRKHDKDLMLVAHTNDVASQERRNDRRVVLNQDCTFSAVKVVSKTSHGKTESDFVPQDKKYPAKMKDISASGCKIITSLPIKEGQYVHLHFMLEGDDCAATGIILNTFKNKGVNSYLLRVQFAKVDPKIRNIIMATVYNYRW